MVDYNSVYEYPVIDVLNELKNLEEDNSKLIGMLNKQREKIDDDLLMGRIESVTAFMRFKALTMKGVKLQKMLNEGLLSEIVIKEDE